MRGLQAELRRITTTRLWWLLLICVGVLSAGSAVLPAVVAVTTTPTGDAPFADPGIVRSVVHAGNTLSRVLAMVLGIVVVGGEFRYQTLAATLLAGPRRMRVLAAKATALLLVGLLYGVAGLLAGLAVAAGFVSAYGGSLALDQRVTWRSLALGASAVALWTVLGMGVALLVRNLLLAVVVGVGVAFVGESVVAVTLFLVHADRVLTVLPSGATNALLGLTAPVLLASAHPWAWWQGGLVLAGWCLLPVLIGGAVTVRRDVT